MKFKKLATFLISGLLLSACQFGFPQVSSVANPSSSGEVSETSSEPSSETSSESSSESSSSSSTPSSSTPSSSTPSSSPSSTPSSSPSSSSSSASSKKTYSHGEDDILVEDIILASDFISLTVGKSTIIKPTVLPTKATNKTLVYSTSDKNVVTVNNSGYAVAKAEGEAVITVMSTDGTDITREILVSVTQVAIAGISLNLTVVTKSVNETFYIVPNLVPSNASTRGITYSSNKPHIASVDNEGFVSCLADGTAVITVNTPNPSIYATCTVNVVSTGVLGFDFRNNKTYVSVGEEVRFDAKFYPHNASNRKVNYVIEDNTICSVTEDGVVKGLKEGETKVTGTTVEGGFTDETTVVVTASNKLRKTQTAYTYKDFSENNVYGMDHSPSIGDVNWLVIPVWFTDSTSFIAAEHKEDVRSDINTGFFGTNEQTGWRSVKTFYQQESYGNVNISGLTTKWFEPGHNWSKYNDQNATRSLTSLAIQWFKNNYKDIPLSRFDKDKNGTIDSLILVYACPDYSCFSSASSNLWAYCSWLLGTPGNPGDEPTVNQFMWVSYDFLYQRASNNDTSSYVYKRTGKTSYGSGQTTYVTLDTHTFIHESGHLLGADDYYDYSGVASPAGGFSMQDHDCGAHDPFSNMMYGWSAPYIPTDDITLTISPFATSGDMILLTPEWNNLNSPYDEYIILELYTPTGANEFDAKYGRYGRPKLNAVGVRVWHVDARLIYTNGYKVDPNNVTNNPYDPRGRVLHMMANSYPGSSTDRIPLGESYGYYNLLQLIRNNTSVNYVPTNMIGENDLFKTGSTFKMSTYSKQFVNGSKGKLNDGRVFDWTANFQSVTEFGAVIKLTRG